MSKRELDVFFSAGGNDDSIPARGWYWCVVDVGDDADGSVHGDGGGEA